MGLSRPAGPKKGTHLTKHPRKRYLLPIVGIVLALPGPSAVAGKPALIESHSVPQDSRVRKMMRGVREALGDRVRSGEQGLRTLETVIGRPARPLSSARHAALVAFVKSGAEASYAGEWDNAIRRLDRARRALGRDQLSIARRRTLFRALQRARLLLARCYLRTKKRKLAWALMTEALRAQPDLSPASALYGPPIQRLFYRVKAQLDLQKSRLTVTTEPAGALIFLDGRTIGFSPVTVTDLYPGTYDLIVVKEQQVSRIRRVVVGDRPQAVRIDLTLDRAVRDAPGSGIVLPEGSGRQRRELRFAAQVGTALGAERVLVVGVRRIRGREALVGRVVKVAPSRLLVTAFIYTHGRMLSGTTLTNLAHFLLGIGAPGPGVVVQRGASPPVHGRHGPPRTARAGGGASAEPGKPSRGLAIAGWVLLSGGLAGVGAGGVLIGIDGHTIMGAARAADRYDTDKAGYGVLGVSLAVAAAGAVLVVVDALRRSKATTSRTSRFLPLPTVVPTVVPTSEGAVFGLTGRF